MKLLFCPKCQDIFKLSQEWRTCSCGEARGHYVGEIDAKYTGGVPIGIENTSFVKALRSANRQLGTRDGLGIRFEAFVIPDVCPTFKKVPI